MFGRTSRPEPDAIEVLIGPRATFSGRLQCDASIRIDGAVDAKQEAGHVGGRDSHRLPRAYLRQEQRDDRAAGR